MRKHSNKIFLVAVLLPLLLFVFPMWRITLTAPQYPDGVTMYIWISKITGDSESTLQNINILNHYVGMKYIEPDTIKELKYFPIVVLGMVILGIVVWLTKKRKLYFTWTLVLAVLGILGIYDFYLWEYDYGHNLSPTAPIKIPGMVYQPPLLGSKWLLNFKADSWPYWGGIALGLSILLGFLSFLFTKKEKKEEPEVKTSNVPHLSKSVAMLVAAVAVTFLFTSCKIDKEEIIYGDDSCSHCLMKIVQPQYGAEIVTTKGKVYKFDAVECMLDFAKSGNIDQKDIYQQWVVSFKDPKVLFPAAESVYLRSSKLPSPMGMYITAVSDEQQAAEMIRQFGGSLYRWDELEDKYPDLGEIADRSTVH